MRRAVFLVVILAPVVASGCSGRAYFADRWADTKDVFTASVGKGAGAKARVGPVNAGLFLNEDYAGLRGGECFYEPHGWWEDGSGDSALLLLLGAEVFDYQYRPPLSSEMDVMGPRSRIHTVGDDLAARRKSFRFVLYPTVAPEFPRAPSYYTQIEAAVGVWGSLRVGFNPGELLDLLFGWTTLDIYGDDLETRREREAAQETKAEPPK